MNVHDIKKRILDLVRSRYREEGNVPSINTICNEAGLSRTKIYQLFPRGQAEICQAASVPLPLNRIERTKIATMERVKRAMEQRMKMVGEGSGVLGGQQLAGIYCLTPEQMSRFYGLLHLEPERLDIGSIIDTWLDMDTELRREWDLKSISEIAGAVDFARQLRKRRLKSGVYRFDLSSVSEVDSFVKRMSELGWSRHEIPDYLTSLWNLGVPKIVNRQALLTLKGLKEEALKAGKTLNNYLKSLQEEVEKLKRSRDVLRDEIEDLKSERNRQIEETKRLGQLIRTNQAELTRSKEALKTQERLLEEARSAIDEKITRYKVKEFERFEAEFKELIEERKKALEERERELQAKISAYEKKLGEKAMEMKTAEEHVTKLADERASLQEHLDRLKPMVNRYDQVADLKRQLDEKALWLSREFNTRVEEERLLAQKREEMKREFEEQKRIMNHIIEKASPLTHLFLFLSNPKTFPEDHFSELDNIMNELVVWRSFREPPKALRDLPLRSKEPLKMIKADMDRYLEEN